MPTSDLSEADRRLAVATVARLAPDETDVCLSLLEPPSFSERLRGRRGSVGFGLESAVDLLSPYAILGAVWVGALVADEARVVAEKRIRAVARRLFGKVDSLLPEFPESDPENVSAVNALTSLGLSADTAKSVVHELSALVTKPDDLT